MVLIDFLNKIIPGGGKKQPGGGKQILFRASRNILPPPGQNPVWKLSFHCKLLNLELLNQAKKIS